MCGLLNIKKPESSFVEHLDQVQYVHNPPHQLSSWVEMRFQQDIRSPSIIAHQAEDKVEVHRRPFILSLLSKALEGPSMSLARIFAKVLFKMLSLTRRVD